MAIQVKHKFVSAKVDTLDNSKVQPSNWNADHDLLMGAGAVLGRAPGAGQAAATEIPMGATGQAVLATGSQAAAQAAIGADATQATIFAAANKATPVDADSVPLIDSAAGNALKRSTWAQIKATLKAYFDALYLAASYVPTWASITGKPTTIAGYGITDANTLVIGVNQTWNNFTGVRTYDTVYQNNTGKPIQISIAGDAGGGGRFFQVSPDNATWTSIGQLTENGTDYSGLSVIVPAGLYYRMVGTVQNLFWAELR